MKRITFCKKDEELIKRIVVYQKDKCLPSFIEAVRQLCNDALDCNVNVKIKLK